MAEEKKKKSRKKKETEVIETPVVQENVVSEQPIIEEVQPVKEVVVPSVFKVEKPVLTTEDISSIIDDSINEVMSESKVEVEETPKVESEKFTTEEKLYILKLISQGYRPFDIVKKARFALNLSEEKRKKLSLDIRTVTQLVNALEDAI